MCKRILIDGAQADETRVVVLEGQQLVDYDEEHSAFKRLKGNIYLAKISRIEPSLQAAFVDYGGQRQGFLSFSEVHPDYYRIPVDDQQALIKAERSQSSDDEELDDDSNEPESGDADSNRSSERRGSGRIRTNKYRIQEVLSRGQVLLVQIVKEERGNKGAALSSYLSIAGKYCVLMPNSLRGGGVSRKVGTAQKRSRLREVMEELNLSEGMALILRTAASDRTKAEIKRDFRVVSELWDKIRQSTMEAIAPCLINEEADIIRRVLRDTHGTKVEEVLVEGADAYASARAHMKGLMPSAVKIVKRYTETLSLFQHFGVEEQLMNLHGNMVFLPSGGSLVITQTEALVAIDVNSGRSIRERDIEQTALLTNLEAAQEIARQLRLRDLAGLIVIDFIDMSYADQNHQVERAFKQELNRDRARTQITGISTFGILEMSRQRMRVSMGSTSSAVCAHCSGMGVVPSVDARVRRIVHQLRRVMAEVQKHRAEQSDPEAKSADLITIQADADTLCVLFNNYFNVFVWLRDIDGITVRVDPTPLLSGRFVISLNGNVVVDSASVPSSNAQDGVGSRPSLTRRQRDSRSRRGGERSARGGDDPQSRGGKPSASVEDADDQETAVEPEEASSSSKKPSRRRGRGGRRRSGAWGDGREEAGEGGTANNAGSAISESASQNDEHKETHSRGAEASQGERDQHDDQPKPSKPRRVRQIRRRRSSSAGSKPTPDPEGSSSIPEVDAS